MVDFRFLSASLVVLATSGVLAAPEPPAPLPKVAVPKWVYEAGAAGRVPKAGTGNFDFAFRREALNELKRSGTTAEATRPVLKSQSKRLAGRSINLAKGFAGGAAMDVIQAGAELLRGQVTTSQAVESALLGVAARAGGMAVGAGVVWAVGTWGVASTGTAISTLSGAAYTSAVLAKLGGGTITAGGGGVALGSAVLTGGVLVATFVVGYGAKKLYDLVNPAERDGYMRYYEGVSRHDLVDATTAAGAAILAEQRAITEMRRRLDRQRMPGQ